MNQPPLFDKLRKPDFGRQRTPRGLELWLKSGILDICRPFEPWALPESPQWNEDPYRDDTWGLYYHSLVWFSIIDMGAEQAPTEPQRQQCLARLKDLFTSYVAFLAVTPESEFHKMVWFDHSTAWRASTLAYFYEKYFRGTLTESQSGQLSAVVRMHDQKLREFIASGRWRANNHGIFHAEALWDMAHVFTDVIDPEMTRELALEAMRNVYGEMIDAEEGVCREHSLYYHLFDAWLLAQSARYMAQFDVDVIPGYRKVLQDMIEFYHRVAPGMRSLPAVGDTTFGRTSENPMLDEITALVEPTSLSVSLANKGGEGEAPEALTSFPRTGFHVFHGGGNGKPEDANVAVVLDKPYLGAHAHVDGGSFTINLAGEDMVVDSGGPYAYGQKLRFNYFKAAEAHNVLLVDQKSSQYLTRTASQVAGDLGRGVRIICDDLSGAAWQRCFVDLGEGTYLVLDEVKAKGRHRFDTLIRFAPSITLREEADGRIEARSQTRTLFVHQVGAKALDRHVGPGGNEGFPRSWVTRDLAHLEPAPIICTGFRATGGWIATLLTADPDMTLRVHQLHGGKLLRALVSNGSEGGRFVEIDVTLPERAPRITTYRQFAIAALPAQADAASARKPK
ncbi:heparinase II/III domain-containing protein [Arenimonas aestuarii]